LPSVARRVAAPDDLAVDALPRGVEVDGGSAGAPMGAGQLPHHLGAAHLDLHVDGPGRPGAALIPGQQNGPD
jgi:hypothetical protein